MNKVILKGNIGNAPRIKLTQDGHEIATFSLATNTSWKACPRPHDPGYAEGFAEARGGEHGEPEWKTHTDWHRVIVFRKGTIGWIKDVLKKGDTIYLEGKLSYHKKKDKSNHSAPIAYIVISDKGGKIEHLRSRKPDQSEEQRERKETTIIENDFPNLEENPSTSFDDSEETPQFIQPIHTKKEKI